MKLTGFDLHIDENTGRILILKTPGTDGRAAVIEILPTDFNAAILAIESKNETTFSAEIKVEINKQ